MQPDEPSGRRIGTSFDGPPPSAAEIEAQQHAEAVKAFDAALEGFIAPEMPDAKIEQAFRYALAEWRRTAPERAEAERERQCRDREAHAERQRYWQEHPEEAPAPMIDPAWVFRGGRDGGAS